MKNNLLSKLSSKTGMLRLKLKKHSPELLMIFGGLGVVASGILACIETRKLDSVVEECNDDINYLKEQMNDEDISDDQMQELRKDLVKANLKKGVKLVKLYAPSVTIGGLSLASMFTSHKILCKRNAALVASYVTVKKGFDTYRARVIERFGKDVDQEIRYNVRDEITETTTTDKKGKEVIVAETSKTIDSEGLDRFAIKFTPDNPSEMDLYFLKQEEQYATDRLKARGYLFINEVRERLSLKPLKECHDYGWIYSKDNPVGDNFVDFGIYSANTSDDIRKFIDGEKSYLNLVFNYDGPIIDLI